jgi:translation initiation factor 1
MSRKNRQSRLVYSTEAGRLCPGCQRQSDQCVCNDRSRPRNAGDGIIRLRRETKGRKGAVVTLVDGLPLSDVDLAKLAKRLKSACGVGGTVRNGLIELQGDQRQKIQPLLEADGYTVKIAGG